jgi:hypothetical protein
MHVCATLGSTATRLREKIFKKNKNIKRKKSQSRYISRMRGGALILVPGAAATAPQLRAIFSQVAASRF